MNKIRLNANFAFRSDTFENWQTANPVLEDGEVSIVKDKRNTSEFCKIGDGETAWNNLPYSKGPIGETGPQGPQGNTGPQGPKGDTGEGVPSGGTTGQVLKKKSGTDYDTEWANEQDISGKQDKFADITNTKTAIVLETTKHVMLAPTSNKFQTLDPIEPYDLSNKQYVDNHHDNTKVDKVTGKGLSTNDFTNGYKTKVDNAITNAVNNLTNYYLKNETYTKSEVNGLISAIENVKIQIVTSLPQTGESNIIYFVPKTPSQNDSYDEYVWISNAFEHIGSTDVDLSNYYTKSEVDNLIPTKTSDLTNDSGFLTSHQDISGKQDKNDNSLQTTNKTVVGAINELGEKETITDKKLKNVISLLQGHEFSVQQGTSPAYTDTVQTGAQTYASLDMIGGKSESIDGDIVSGKCDKIITKNDENIIIQEFNIPSEIQNLEGYGWGAGTVCNYIDFKNKTFVRNLGKFYLKDHNDYYGLQTITSDSWVRGYIYGVPNSKNTKNLVVSNYFTRVDTIYDSSGSGFVKSPQISLSTYSNLLYFSINLLEVSPNWYNLNYSQQQSALREFFANNNIYIYYELNEPPTPEDISQYLTDDNFIETEVGGTVTFHQQDDTTLLLPNAVNYMVRNEDAI